MAENAILNLTPQQQQTSLNSQLSSLNSGFLNNSNELPIANLLAATVGGLNDPNDPNTAAAFATLIGTLSLKTKLKIINILILKKKLTILYI